MIQKIFKKTLLGISVASFLLVIGCSKLTTENYDQLKIGMPYAEVVAILGKADECEGALGLKNCVWGNDKKYIHVAFAGDVVLMFSGKGL
ncbi:MAG: DUF3862 domain-containing protein [Deltaproteobacteria bacterium]|nr:DUF3862 domain-containing protein [Deltaproteobacteria bacterium]